MEHQSEELFMSSDIDLLATKYIKQLDAHMLIFANESEIVTMFGLDQNTLFVKFLECYSCAWTLRVEHRANIREDINKNLFQKLIKSRKILNLKS